MIATHQRNVEKRKGSQIVMGRGAGEMTAQVGCRLNRTVVLLICGYIECLRSTKCLQRTAETLQGVADLYDRHVSAVFILLNAI